MANATVYNRVCDFFDRWLKPSRDLRDFALLEGREFADLALSRMDVMTFTSGPRDIRDRIAGMSGRLGVDFEELMEPHWRAVDIARNCTNCRERRACKRYLRGHGPREDFKDFCPNARAFEELSAAGGLTH